MESRQHNLMNERHLLPSGEKSVPPRNWYRERKTVYSLRDTTGTVMRYHALQVPTSIQLRKTRVMPLLCPGESKRMLESDAPRTSSADKYPTEDSLLCPEEPKRMLESDGGGIVSSGDDDKVVIYLIDYYTPEMTKS